ncbi:hypothetical protein Tco_1262481 [Tanacetum coccineum]
MDHRRKTYHRRDMERRRDMDNRASVKVNMNGKTVVSSNPQGNFYYPTTFKQWHLPFCASRLKLDERLVAFPYNEEVTNMKEPFDITKATPSSTPASQSLSLPSQLTHAAALKSANIPSLYSLSSFELIVFGTLNLHTTCSHANFSACLPFIVVRGFASTYLVECSTAIARNFKFPGAVDRGPRMLIPQWLNCHMLPTVIASLLDTFLSE